MDPQRFDDLARVLATRTTRRRVLRGITGTLAGLGLVSAVGQVASADSQNDCATFCRQLPPGPARGACVSDAAHGLGQCYDCGPGAPAGSTAVLCDDSCVDTQTDAGNCGECGNACPAGVPCINGACGCPSWLTLCNGNCVSSYCNFGEVFSSETCQCECAPGRVPLISNGRCSIACTTDADCGGYPGSCATSTEGDRVCADGYLVYCTTCSASTDCQQGCFAVNVICSASDDNVCRVLY
jgi:hypothetical protein